MENRRSRKGGMKKKESLMEDDERKEERWEGRKEGNRKECIQFGQFGLS